MDDWTDERPEGERPVSTSLPKKLLLSLLVFVVTALVSLLGGVIYVARK